MFSFCGYQATADKKLTLCNLNLCLYYVNLMSIKRTSGKVLTLQQGPAILLSQRYEAGVDENSHSSVAGYISKSENNEAIDDI